MDTNNSQNVTDSETSNPRRGQANARGVLDDTLSAGGGAHNEGVGASGQLLKGKQIVWVEDDPFLTAIIARKIMAEGVILLTAKSYQEALVIMQDQVPDIIMLDILLSGVDGFEILTKIKSDERLKNVPVILLSNLGQQSDIERGLALGAESFLIKASHTLDEILSEIRKVIGKYQK